MRVLTLIRSSEELGEPPASFFAAMEKELPAIDAQFTMIDSQALVPTAVAGAVVRSAGGRTAVVDGPFTESKELVAGYSIGEFESFEQAVDVARQFLAIHEQGWPGWSGEAEVRRIAD